MTYDILLKRDDSTFAIPVSFGIEANSPREALLGRLYRRCPNDVIYAIENGRRGGVREFCSFPQNFPLALSWVRDSGGDLTQVPSTGLAEEWRRQRREKHLAIE